MKLLFERWRRYLNEADPFADTPLAKPTVTKTPELDEPDHPRGDIPEETREKYFGANPEHLQCIQDLRKPPELRSVSRSASTGDSYKISIPTNIEERAQDFYDCMNRAGYSKIGEGSFRTVFNIPNKPHLVLKTPNPRWISKSPKHRRNSLEMNKKEAQGAFQTTSDLVVKVYDSAEDYFWIVSEKVYPIDTWGGMSEYFPVWLELVQEGLVREGTLSAYFQDFMKALKMQELRSDPGTGRFAYGIKDQIIDMFKTKFSGGTVADRGWSPEEHMPEIDKFVNKLLRNSMFANIRDLLAKFNLPHWDIRPQNVGYAMRNGKKQFVIIDPGFALDDAGSAGLRHPSWGKYVDSGEQTAKKATTDDATTSNVVANLMDLI